MTDQNLSIWMDMHQRRVPLSTIIANFVVKSHSHLHDLLNSLASVDNHMSDEERRTCFLRYFESKRLQLVRILIIVKWLQTTAGDAGILDNFKDVMLILENQHWRYQLATESLKVVAHNLEAKQLPMWDVQTALHVMTSGSYRLLPRIIETKLDLRRKVSDKMAERVIDRLNDKIRVHLISSELPSEFRNVRVERGFAMLSVPGEMQAEVSIRMTPVNEDTSRYAERQQQLALADKSQLSLEEVEQLNEEDTNRLVWQLFSLHICMKVDVSAENGGSSPPQQPLISATQTLYLQSALNEGMLTSQTPLRYLYDTCHSFCARLYLQCLHRQAAHVNLHRQFGELYSVYDGGAVLKVSYWRQAVSIPFPGQIFKVQQSDKRLKRNAPPNSILTPEEELCSWICVVDNGVRLCVRHHPRFDESDTLSKLTIDPQCVSLPTLLSKAQQIHGSHRMLQLYTFLVAHRHTNDKRCGFAHASLDDEKTCIRITFSFMLPSSVLLVTLDRLTGSFLVRWERKANEHVSLLPKLVSKINQDIGSIIDTLSNLRVELVRHHFCRAVGSAVGTSGFVSPNLCWPPDQQPPPTHLVCLPLTSRNFAINTFFLAFQFCVALNDKRINNVQHQAQEDEHHHEECDPHIRMHVIIAENDHGMARVVSVVTDINDDICDIAQSQNLWERDVLSGVIRSCARKLPLYHLKWQLESVGDWKSMRLNDTSFLSSTRLQWNRFRFDESGACALRENFDRVLPIQIAFNCWEDAVCVDIIHEEFRCLKSYFSPLDTLEDVKQGSNVSIGITQEDHIRLVSQPLHNFVMVDVVRMIECTIATLEAAVTVLEYNNCVNAKSEVLPPNLFQVKSIGVGTLHLTMTHDDDDDDDVILKWSSTEGNQPCLSINGLPCEFPHTPLIVKEFEEHARRLLIQPVVWLLQRIYWSHQTVPMLIQFLRKCEGNDIRVGVNKTVQVFAQSSTRVRLQFAKSSESRLDLRMVSPLYVIAEFVNQKQDRSEQMPVTKWNVDDMISSLDKWYTTFGFVQMKSRFYSTGKVAVHLQKLYDRMKSRPLSKSSAMLLPHVCTYDIQTLRHAGGFGAGAKVEDQYFGVRWHFDDEDHHFCVEPSDQRLTKDQRDTLTKFYETCVGGAPFNSVVLSNFIRMLTFPSQMLHQMLKVCHYQLTPQDGATCVCRLDMGSTYPNGVDTDGNSVEFALRFWFNGDRVPSLRLRIRYDTVKRHVYGLRKGADSQHGNEWHLLYVSDRLEVVLQQLGRKSLNELRQLVSEPQATNL